MKKLIGGAALLFLVGGTGSGAQAAPWCAFYDASTYNCGFHTFRAVPGHASAAPADGAGRILFEGLRRRIDGRPAGETPEARY